MQARYEILKAADTPLTTVFIPVTREWFIDTFLEGFEKVIIPKSQCELLFYIDSDSDWLWRRLLEYGRSVMDKWAGVKIYQAAHLGPSEVNPGARRLRIVTMKEDSKRLINSDSQYVFCLEDDTVAPTTAYIRLFKTIQLQNVGYVQGVQAARWRMRILGVWRMDDVEDPKVVETLAPRKAGLTQIEGGGFYCYITRAELYRKATYRVEAECLGVDVNYCRDVRRMGYRAYVDWTVPCEHHDHVRVIRPEDADQRVRFFKHGDTWSHKLYDKRNGEDE